MFDFSTPLASPADDTPKPSPSPELPAALEINLPRDGFPSTIAPVFNLETHPALADETVLVLYCEFQLLSQFPELEVGFHDQHHTYVQFCCTGSQWACKVVHPNGSSEPLGELPRVDMHMRDTVGIGIARKPGDLRLLLVINGACVARVRAQHWEYLVLPWYQGGPAHVNYGLERFQYPAANTSVNQFGFILSP
jgi:hypothetical protein